FVERVSELVGHSRSHPDPLNRCAERKDDLATAGCDSVSELALVVWSQGAMDESASLTQWCALGSRLCFHRLDRLGHLCLLHSFLEPPVPWCSSSCIMVSIRARSLDVSSVELASAMPKRAVDSAYTCTKPPSTNNSVAVR